MEWAYSTPPDPHRGLDAQCHQLANILSKHGATFAFLNKALTLSGSTRRTKLHDRTAASQASIYTLLYNTPRLCHSLQLSQSLGEDYLHIKAVSYGTIYQRTSNQCTPQLNSRKTYGTCYTVGRAT